jgi:surface antigen
MPITDQTEKAQYWQGVAIGSPEQNGRGGYTRIAMNMDGQGQPNFVIEDFPLIAVRY